MDAPAVTSGASRHRLSFHDCHRRFHLGKDDRSAVGENALRGTKVAQSVLRGTATIGIPGQKPAQRAAGAEFLNGLNDFAYSQGGWNELGALQIITQKGAQPLVRWRVHDIGKLVKVKRGEEIAHKGAARRAHGNLGSKPAENGR